MIFLNSASSAAALVFYLPGVCTHTDTEGKQRKTRVRNILKSLEKTQYLMNTLYLRTSAPQPICGMLRPKKIINDSLTIVFDLEVICLFTAKQIPKLWWIHVGCFLWCFSQHTMHTLTLCHLFQTHCWNLLGWELSLKI